MIDIQKLLDQQRAMTELHKKSDKQINATVFNYSRTQDPEYRKHLTQVVNSEQWKTAHHQGCLDRSRSKTWHKNVESANKQKAQDPEYAKKHRASLKKRDQDPVFQQKLCDNAKKRQKTVITPDGEFKSRKIAAMHYNRGPSWILTQIKKYPDTWFYKD
jgi:hypothetical protein